MYELCLEILTVYRYIFAFVFLKEYIKRKLLKSLFIRFSGSLTKMSKLIDM